MKTGNTSCGALQCGDCARGKVQLHPGLCASLGNRPGVFECEQLSDLSGLLFCSVVRMHVEGTMNGSRGTREGMVLQFRSNARGTWSSVAEL